ncbi:hypothetical protein GCM10009647_085720 [Streptomyces sanglieri]
MAVDVFAGEGHEEAARLGLPAVEHGRRGHCHGAVALDRPADNCGDLTEAERDHARTTQGSAKHINNRPVAVLAIGGGLAK